MKSLNNWSEIKKDALIEIKSKLGFEPKEMDGVPKWLRKMHYLRKSKYNNNYRVR